MIAVLATAKTLDFDSPVTVDRFSQPEFLQDATDLVEAIRDRHIGDLGTLLRVSDAIAAENAARYSRWRPGLHDSPGAARQAIHAFHGEVYRALSAGTLSEDDRGFAQEHLRIISGLYGVLRPLDLILPYRLEMATPLQTGRGGNLYEFWRPRIAQSLRKALQGHRAPVLLNLASQEYIRAIDLDELDSAVITPVFRQERGGKLRTVAVYAKRARGAMARFLVESRIDDPEGLKEFRTDGYRFRPGLSDDSSWVFVKSEQETR